jgi:hypothetical protein
MRKILTFIFLLINKILFSQCKDIYGAKCDCPTEQDSLVIYNNAIVVVEFYDKNKSYTLVNSTELITIRERKEIFDKLEDARRMFFVLRRTLKVLSDNPNYKDITYKNYYNVVDDNRFYQRELENQIVNADAPFPIYDNRIAPVILNVYENRDSSSIYFGDLVQIPLYVPVVIKPYTLLTEEELILRNKILHIVPNIEKLDTAKRYFVKRDTTIQKKPYEAPIAIYCYNGYGSGSIIGYMYGRYFKKLNSSEWKEYAVAKYAQEILKDEKKLSNLLKIKFGDYFLGFIN